MMAKDAILAAIAVTVLSMPCEGQSAQQPAPAAKPILDTVTVTCLEGDTLKSCDAVKSTLPSAQTPPATATAPAKAITPTPSASGGNFYLTGAECGASTAPHCGGFAAMAIPVGGGTWSWTKIFEGAPTGGKFASLVTTTGACKDLYTWHMGRVAADVIGCAAIGAAQSGNTITGAFDGGGGLVLSGLSQRWAWLKAALIALQDKAAGVTVTKVLMGIGGRF